MPKLKLLAAVIAAGAFFMVALAIFIFRLGNASAVADIDKTNQEAQDEADQASSVFERCIDGGGLFDFATGKCRGR